MLQGFDTWHWFDLVEFHDRIPFRPSKRGIGIVNPQRHHINTKQLFSNV